MLASKDMTLFVRSYDARQHMRSFSKYKTKLIRMVNVPFSKFPVVFARLFEKSKERHDSLLVCVEHLTGQQIARLTRNATKLKVLAFVDVEIVYSFGPPFRIICNNTACFTAWAVQEYMGRCGIERKTVLAYALTSNGRAEKVMGLIKKCLQKIVYEVDYCRRPWRETIALFKLIFVAEPKLGEVAAEAKRFQHEKVFAAGRPPG